MYKKFKFLIMLLVFSLAIIGGGVKNSVSAAIVGRPLISPEPGWQRIDDIDSHIKYTGSWNYYGGNGNEYNSTVHYTMNVGSTYSFIFKGTYFRLIGFSRNNYDTANALISIDGQASNRLSIVFPGINNAYKTLYYSSALLDDCYHKVTVTCNDSKLWLENDAIDLYGSVAPWSDNNLLLDQTSLNLKSRQVQTLTPSIIGHKNLDKTITWSSSDNNIAVVDANGNVQGLKNGTATITACVKGTDLKAVCTVNVTGSDRLIDLAPVKYVVNPDGTVDVKVLLKEKAGAEAISLQYDSSKLKFINAETAHGMRISKCKNDSLAGTAFLNLVTKNILKSDKVESEIATLHFQAKSLGKAHIRITGCDVSNCNGSIKTLNTALCGETDILIANN